MSESTTGALSTVELLQPDATLRRIATGAAWSEGPVWLADRGVVRWSDIPGNRILEVDPVTELTSVYATDVEFTNGRTLGLHGEVLQCSHGRRAIERDVDGTVTTLVDSWDGHRLNSPNDLVVASDGAIFFTDPPYGIVQAHEGHLGDPEYGANYVFRFDPNSAEIRPIVFDVDEPNGLAFSPDESVLYVSDTSVALRRNGTGNHHIVAYDVAADWSCSNKRVFAVIETGVPDGFRVDEAGRVWTSSGDAVLVYSPEAELLLRIPVPETVGNLCFGGPEGTTLFVAAGTSMYCIETAVRQASRPGVTA